MCLLNRKARGISLLELIVSIVIVAALLGLLLTVVSKVRFHASVVSEQNRVKQLILCVCQFESANGGRYPSVMGGTQSADPQVPILITLIDLIEPNQIASHDIFDSGFRNRLYQSSLDPSYVTPWNGTGNTSYTFNALVFHDSGRAQNMTDGLSNTIATAETYANCGAAVQFSTTSKSGYEHRFHEPFIGFAMFHAGPTRRPSFADQAVGDVFPRTKNSGELEVVVQYPLYPGLQDNIQFKPTQNQCNPFIPNSPNPNGMVSAYLDGSVRILSNKISKTIFWSQVTPSGGEFLSLE